MSSYYDTAAEYPPLDGAVEQEAFPPLDAEADYQPPSDAPLSYADAVQDGEEEAEAGEEAAEEEEQQEEQDPYTAAAAPAADCDEQVAAALDAAGEDIAAAAAQLWDLDVNRLVPGTDYTVSTQRAPWRDYRRDSDSDDSEDDSEEEEESKVGPFVTWLSESVWERDTYALLKALLDNYSAETGVPERVSSEERAEEQAFVAAVCATPVMQFARGWLAAHCPFDEARAQCADSPESFGALVHDVWFALYGRDGRRDSSGFEHVFCGEVDDGRVKGLHNFTQVVVEEARGNLQFGGCVGRRRRRRRRRTHYDDGQQGGDEEDAEAEKQVATIRFQWLGLTKRASSMFVGVSPEFEVALYTLWWLGGGGGEEVEIGPYTVRVKVHELRGKLGAAYPEVLHIDYDELDSGW